MKQLDFKDVDVLDSVIEMEYNDYKSSFQGAILTIQRKTNNFRISFSNIIVSTLIMERGANNSTIL